MAGFLVLFVFFSAIYLLVFFKGKSILTKKLESLLHKKVMLDCVYLSSPFNLVIKNLDIQGLARIEKVSISPSVVNFLTGKIVFNRIKIIKPQIVFQRIPPVVSAVKLLEEPQKLTTAPNKTEPETPSIPSVPAPKIKKEGIFYFILKRLDVNDGRLTFIDHVAEPHGIKLTVKDINFNLTNLYVYPVSAITNFELKGKIPWGKNKEGIIEASGWLNIFKLDMQANLKVLSIDGVYLHPYYANWLKSLEKARIESATLNFTSNITSLSNNLKAECCLELSDIVRKPRPPEEQAQKAEIITDAVLGILRASDKEKIVLDFTILTKMDRPEFGFNDIRAAFEKKLTEARSRKGFELQDILLFPGKLVEGTVKGTAELSKAVITGVFAVGNEFRKVADSTLKKEKKESK